MSSIKTPTSLGYMPLVLVQNMVSLATSGFGVVVALAWNEVIQQTVKQYIDPYLGKNSGLISMLIYAVIVTLLAVLVTMQLTTLERQISAMNVKLLKHAAARAKKPEESRSPNRKR